MEDRAASISQQQLLQQLQEKDQRISQLQSLVEIAFSGQADKHVASAGWIEEVRAALSTGASLDDGKATRALQSSLADAKVEVEFWKRKVDDLSTRLTESQIERRRLEDAQKAAAAGVKQQSAAQHSQSSSSSSAAADERLRVAALEQQLKNLHHSIDVHASKALRVKACVSNTVTRLALKVAAADKQLLLSQAWSSWLLMARIQRDDKKLNRVLDLSRQKQAFWQLRAAATSQHTVAAPAPHSLPPSIAPHPSHDAVKGSDIPDNLQLMYRMSQQRCSELESKLQQQHERLSVANPVNIIETARAEAIADLEQSRNSLSERCIQLESILAQIEHSTPPHVVAQMRSREGELLQLVGELRGALAAAAEKVDEMEERERATAASHKQIVEQEKDKSFSAGAQSQMSVLTSVSERLVADMRQMEKELSAAHAAAEAQMQRMQAEAAVERERWEAALKESERRAIADIERLQSEFAADRSQQQQQQQQLQQRAQADAHALRTALDDTETQRDAAIGRASLMKEQALASHDYVRRVVEVVAPALQQEDRQSVTGRAVPATDEELLKKLACETRRLHDIAVKYPELQSNFDMVMSQNATLSQELDVLRESLTRLQTSANQTLADLSEKEAELRIQKRERFECESKLYSAAAEHDRMKSDAQASAARMLQLEGDLISTEEALRDKDAANSALRQELGLLREQLEVMRQLKDQLEQSSTIEKEKGQRLSSALLQTEADLRDLTARYQQLLSKLTHAEAELDTLKRSEKDRNIQLQRALADVQQLGNTVQEQLAAIQQLEAANKNLEATNKKLEATNQQLAAVSVARAEKMQENESVMELLQQALAGLQEDRRSMQGTVEQLKSVETQQLASKLDGQAELLRVIAHENAGSRQVLLSEHEKLLQQLEALRERDHQQHQQQQQQQHVLHDSAPKKFLEVEHTNGSCNSSGEGSGWTEVSLAPQVMEMKQADLAAKSIRRFLRNLDTGPRHTFRAAAPGLSPKIIEAANVLTLIPAFVTGIQAALEEHVMYAT